MLGRAALLVTLTLISVGPASGQAKAPVKPKPASAPGGGISARLQAIPVFVLMDSTGKPLLAGEPGGKRHVVAFFRKSLALSAAEGVRRANPAVGRQLVLRPVPLGELFQRFRGGEEPALAMVPDPEEVERARKVMVALGRTGSFEGVPLFVAKAAGKGYLNVTQNGRTFIPVFFSLSELEQLRAQVQADAKAPAGVQTTTVDVLSLESLLTRWQTSKDQGLGPITLVPSAKALAEATP